MDTKPLREVPPLRGYALRARGASSVRPPAMDAIALDRASPMPPARSASRTGAPCEMYGGGGKHNLLDDARWLLASIPSAAALFGTDEQPDSPQAEGPEHLLEIPTAATPQRKGQDPRVATRHFPSPWLREQQQQAKSSSPEVQLGGALSRAIARGKSPVAQRRARSVLQNITNASPAASPAGKRAAPATPMRKPSRASQRVDRTPPPSDRAGAPAAAETDLAKQAKLEALKAELGLLQLFSERKNAAIQDGCPDNVRLSLGSVQTRAAGADEWSTAAPTVVVVEVQPLDDTTLGSNPSASNDMSSTTPQSSPAAPANRSRGVLRPASPRAEPQQLANAEKEAELARLKGECLDALHHPIDNLLPGYGY